MKKQFLMLSTKLNKISNGRCPSWAPGLEELIEKIVNEGIVCTKFKVF